MPASSMANWKLFVSHLLLLLRRCLSHDISISFSYFCRIAFTLSNQVCALTVTADATPKWQPIQTDTPIHYKSRMCQLKSKWIQQREERLMWYVSLNEFCWTVTLNERWVATNLIGCWVLIDKVQNDIPEKGKQCHGRWKNSFCC